MTDKERYTELIEDSTNILNKMYAENPEQDYIELKNELPNNTNRRGLILKQKSIKSYESEMMPNNCVEAKIKLIHCKLGEIGWFSIIWDSDDNVIDTYFVIN